MGALAPGSVHAGTDIFADTDILLFSTNISATDTNIIILADI